ncbi:hypothetical protein [Myroides guanonis]|uniref:Uncharacterized protein n=1 Tax=Myroides guanonis TaxID=1150112 RepID=A0A1I3QND1_9FLAO|nr:hypothetical protein [Myroides guanonis]SFJ34992.1 hypothetical protein SAMN04487893_10648 [Myroides guanonis]
MNKIKKFIVTLGVFTMTIGSGFAMDINPPAEPVKGIVETVAEAPQQTQPVHSGPFYYEDASGNAVQLSAPFPTNCTLFNTEIECLWEVDDVPVRLYGARYFNMLELKWKVIFPLYERTI